MEVANELGLAGNVYFFGSWASGLKTATSDCDIVFIQSEVPGKPIDSPVVTLQRFAAALSKHGYSNIVTVFQAVVPLLKAVDPDGNDVDLSVSNLLGYHNSRLLGAYCRLDDRVARLGHLVKQFAHHYELIYSSDGHLNSYAYSLLVVFFLMHTHPAPVVPNLQSIADKDPACVQDSRWGTERTWECGFWEEVELVPRSTSTKTVEELLPAFFEFYLNFDWARYAVSIRLALKCGADADGRKKLPDKFTGLHARVAREVWYVEDPFDLGHNLAAKCSTAGRQRIKDAMWKTYEAIKDVPASKVLEAFDAACPKYSESSTDDAQDNATEKKTKTYMLKCRVHQKKVTPEAFANAFAEISVVAVYYPHGLASTATWSDDRPEAFIEFPSECDRKEAHTINETYVSGWQLRLFTCSYHALDDTKAAGVEFTKLPGWDAPKKDVDGSPQEGKQRWRGNKAGGPKGRQRGNQLDLQKQRVQAGVEQAEGYDELNVLRQRAQGLNLKGEVKKCDDKLRAMREAREGRSASGSEGGRPRYLSGSPRLGPAPNPTIPPTPPAPPGGASINSPSGVQFQ